MSEKYNQTMSSLLFLPGANSWYIEGDLDVPVLPPKRKTVFPAVPNSKPILPSGEIANKNQPPVIPNPENGIEEEDIDYETPEEEDMEFEENLDRNGHEIAPIPIIRLDSCGREVEEFCELLSYDDDEPELEADESSSAQSSDDEENIQSASPDITYPSPDSKPVSRVMTRLSPDSKPTSRVMTHLSPDSKPALRVMTHLSPDSKPASRVMPCLSPNKSEAAKPKINGHSKDASTSTSPEIIHHQYWPVKNSPPKTAKSSQTTTKRKKFVTTDVQIDHFNGMMKYTFIKKPVEVSSDEEEQSPSK